MNSGQYTSNRLWLMTLLALGASESLRRKWFWGCTILLVVSVWFLYDYIQHEAEILRMPVHIRNRHDLVMFVAWVGFLTSLGGYFWWIVAHVIRFFGKRVKDDYENDEMFER